MEYLRMSCEQATNKRIGKICAIYSNDYCTFSLEKKKRGKFVVQMKRSGLTRNVFDTIYVHSSTGHFCTTKDVVDAIIKNDPDLWDELKNCKRVGRSAGKYGKYVHESELTDNRYERIFKALSMPPATKAPSLRINKPVQKMSESEYRQRKKELKIKNSYTCSVCGVNCSHLVDGWYFQRGFLIQLHHIDGNHNNNPADGSNWALACLTCHANQEPSDTHKWMLSANRRDKPYIDMHRLLNSERKRQGISEQYNSPHGYLYTVPEKISTPEISIWVLLKTKLFRFLGLIP
tara:strand:- start:47 stop:916 length:870 start_codon:yes stop_codon:yes gene_type:complete